MTALIVLLVVCVFLFLVMPFMKALLKDKRELRERPLSDRFSVFYEIVNLHLMAGQGKLIPVEGDPRSLNLYAERHPNMLIQTYYSTGSLTVRFKYKYFQKELVKEENFYEVCDADIFTQERMANQFVTKMQIAMHAHQQTIGVPDMSAPAGSIPDDDHPIHLVPGMYNDLTITQRSAIINLGYLIYQTPGTPDYAYPSLPTVKIQLNELHVTWADCEKILKTKGEEQVYQELEQLPSHLFDLNLLYWAGLVANATEIDPERKQRFDEAMERLGHSATDIEARMLKVQKLTEFFGLQ